MTAANPHAPPGAAPRTDASVVDAARLRTIRRAVHAWAAVSLRDLPWRRTRDPWEVLVAETMLQQTQVARVTERWPAFLARFPTAEACAVAGAGAVVAEWVGLGYNRRAVNLHRCAVAVTNAGAFPDDLPALLALPGVGPYTARAVLAFAYEADVGVVDTNIGRLLARAIAGQPLRAADAQTLADRLVPRGDGWVWNQAVMDLGAVYCTARSPACAGCPLRRICRWYAAGAPADADPARTTAHTSRPQATFTGSDRQIRGRAVARLAAGERLAAEAICVDDPARGRRIANDLVRDGLAVLDDGVLVLPGRPEVS